ncbi:MAG: hypothetical protein EXR73_08885 [Myxococcales bacterium]|nr:hypothetical protein [Myxococcales bacterium]
MLIEAALTAHRSVDPSGEQSFHPAFHDLDESGRRMVFDAVQRQRTVEQALAPGGLSSTARAVLRRIHSGR